MSNTVADIMKPRQVPSSHSFLSMQSEDFDDENDDDLDNIDTSNMTQEEKDNLRKLRKTRKMNREKLKRAKLNDRFVSLSQMLSIGRTTRVEKLTVLKETIRTLHQLQLENSGLKDQKKRIKEEIVKRRNGGPPFGVVNPSDPKQTYNEFVFQQPKQQTYPNEFQQPKQQSYNEFECQQPKQPHFQMMSPPPFGSIPDVNSKQAPGFKQDQFPQLTWPNQNPNSDLDFAFGNSSDDNVADFLAEENFLDTPHKQQPPLESNYHMDTNIFGLETIRSHDNDSVDMFLADDDASDLLCY